LEYPTAFGTEKLEWCGYLIVKKFGRYVCFDTIYERDGWTNTHTHTHTNTTCVAKMRGHQKYYSTRTSNHSCGNKVANSAVWSLCMVATTVTVDN